MHKGAYIFLLLMSWHHAFCQTPYLKKILFPQKNQTTQVNAILQNKQGYLWLGTDRGLFRYDGTNFHSFTQANGLQDDHVTALAEDSVGRLWLGHSNGKISVFENNAAKAFEPEEGLSPKPVSKILFDKRGILWFATLNDGLYYYRSNRLYRLDDIDGMPDIFVYDITEDEKGNIWAGTDGGIAICTYTGTEVTINTISSAEGLPDNIVKKIALTKNKAWLVTEDAGVVSYDLQTHKIERPFEPWSFGKAIDVKACEELLWVATDQGLLSATREVASQRLIKTENITTLFQDSEQNVWMGLKNGFIRTLGNKVQFLRPEGEKKWDVIAVAADDHNNIWFSTREGLFKSTSTGTVQKQLTGTKFEKSAVISLYFDSKGFIWAGLYDEGLLKINAATGAATSIREGLPNWKRSQHYRMRKWHLAGNARWCQSTYF